MKSPSLEDPVPTGSLVQEPRFRLEMSESGPRFVMVDGAADEGETLLDMPFPEASEAPSQCLAPPTTGLFASLASPAFMPAAPSVPVALSQGAPPGIPNMMELRARPLAAPTVREILEFQPDAPPSPTMAPSRGRHGRPARPMSKRKRALQTTPNAAPAAPTAPLPEASGPAAPAPDEPRSTAGLFSARAVSGPGRLVLNAPPLHSPDVLASVVSLSGAEQMVEARWTDAFDGFELLTAPSAEPPTEEDEAAIEEASEHAVEPRIEADPTPRDMVEQVEPMAVAVSADERDEPYRPAAIPLGSLLLLGLLVTTVALLFARLQPVRTPAAPLARRRPVAAADDLLLRAPLEPRIQKALATGQFVIVMQGPDRRATQNLVGSLSFQSLAQAQEIARTTSGSLESPLFIVRQDSPQDHPYIADVVNPGDRAARLDFLLAEWQLKQSALGLPSEGYGSRAALNPNRTLAVMSNFIRIHPDSRMVEQALKDMRYVSFNRLQDPNKFYVAVQRLLDQGFRQMARRGGPWPELANLLNPYLKQAMNQRLYEQVHRYQGAREAAR